MHSEGQKWQSNPKEIEFKNQGGVATELNNCMVETNVAKIAQTE